MVVLWTNAEATQVTLQSDMDGINVRHHTLSFLVQKWRPRNKAEQAREPWEKLVAFLPWEE